MAYAYKGTNFSTVEAPSEYTIDPRICGTFGGYRKHKRNHETICPPCREAKRIRSAEDRAANAAERVKNPPMFDPSTCGTSAGYQRHAHYGVPSCPPCRAARTAYIAEYRARRKANDSRKRRAA